MTEILTHDEAKSRDQGGNFTEWDPKPVIEISFKGDILYLNLAARAQFPTLQPLGPKHPILSDLENWMKDFQAISGEFTVFFRELNYLGSIYEQHIISFLEKKSIFIYMDDITARTLAEKQLNQKNMALTEATVFLKNILESSIEYSIIALDLEGRILTWNAGAKHIYGYAAAELVGKQKVSILCAPKDLESGNLKKFMDTVLKEGKAEGTFERIRKNGESFTAMVVMNMRYDAFNNPIGYLLISKDITEQEQLEEQRRINQELEEQNLLVLEVNRLKSVFLANMSHELRTPLNGVIGFSELMYEEKLGTINAEQKDALNDVLSSGKHLQGIINDILDLTRIDIKKMEFKPVEIKVKEIINEVTDGFLAIINKKGMKISVTVDDEIKSIFLDVARFKQVLNNYLSNAFKFTQDHGCIQIRIKPETKDSFRLEVEDDGKSIDEKDIKKLFVAFQQLDSGASKHYGGTGLGLFLTKRLVEGQGGTVGVSCHPQGKIFYAVLPRKYP